MEKSPQPISPNNTSAIASAINFSWTSVQDATDYELALGYSQDLNAPDLSFHTGATNVLTLYSAVQEDGRTLYWKVRAMRNTAWSEWSTPVSFVAGTFEGQVEQTAQRRPAAQTSRSTRSSAPSSAPAGVQPTAGTRATLPPGMLAGTPGTKSTSTAVSMSAPVYEDPITEIVDGSTTLGQAVTFFGIMVISFLALLLVISTAIPKS